MRKNYSILQGPCDAGFHVPLDEEWYTLKNIMYSLGLSTGTSWIQNLHFPLSGYRSYSDGNVVDQANLGKYWHNGNRGSFSDYINCTNISSSSIDIDGYTDSGYGCSIRPFYNYYVEPDNTWTVINGTLGSSGIFHLPSKGIISLNDGVDEITISDKNLGATIVYNSGDILSESNCGKYYQWGNCYGFPRTGNVSLGSRADVAGYGPYNLFESNMYVYASSYWYIKKNFDLWGLLTFKNEQNGIFLGGNTIVDYEPMRGPCDKGYHIPLNSEIQLLKTIMDNLGLTEGSDWLENLFMGKSACREDSDGGIMPAFANNIAFRSCELGHNSTNYYGYATEIFDSSIYINEEYITTYGHSIRPFKDKYEEPDSTWDVIQGQLGYIGTPSSGIFHNESKGILSITDGTNKITISDKNLGAINVYHTGDPVNQDNCGFYYQCGNNHGFPGFGEDTPYTSSTQVDITGYGPGNYYYGDYFITGDQWFIDNANGFNLWGGNTSPINSKRLDYSLLQGPCPEGFHVPTYEELETFLNIVGWNTYRVPFLNSGGIGLRSNDGKLFSQTVGTPTEYRCSSISGDETYILTSRENNTLFTILDANRTILRQIIPFANEFVEPTDAWDHFSYPYSTSRCDMYANSELGLVSIIHENGKDKITIADRCLGATNGGAIGYYYQRGNNHGFRIGDSLPDPGKVNTAGYGHNNPYSSATANFTNVSNKTDNRSLQNNKDLRGYKSFCESIEPNIYNIYSGYKKDKSILQGPCPDGFHIPLYEEFNNFNSIIGRLKDEDGGYTMKYFYEGFLHLPYAGDLKYSTGNPEDQEGNYGMYIMSDLDSRNDEVQKCVLSGENIRLISGSNYGCSLRPFYNNSISPEGSGRICEYQGGDNSKGGIYRNELLHLITISYDGKKRITIYDKNCGANEVYNSGDEYTQSNCGLYYQRGNCFGFARTGAINTTFNKIDGSLYGPDNLLYSDVFITNSQSKPPYNPLNRNIRGYETYNSNISPIANIPEVYLGNVLIRKERAIRYTEGNNEILTQLPINASLYSLTAYGKCELIGNDLVCNNGTITDVYTKAGYISNSSNTRVYPGIILAVDDFELEVQFSNGTSSLYILQSRPSSSGVIHGISGSSSGTTITGCLSAGGSQKNLTSAITRSGDNIYLVKYTVSSGTHKLYVKNTTNNTEDTQTGTYTSGSYDAATTQVGLFGQAYNALLSGCKVYYFKITYQGQLLFDCIPCKDSSGASRFYNKVDGTFISAAGGTITASDMGNIYPAVTGDQEIIQDSDNNTSYIEPLLSVGDIKDEQNVITGAITRKCGICKYDGTQTIPANYISSTGGLDNGAIIVYELDTPYTESVSPQTLTSPDLYISQSGLSNMHLKALHDGYYQNTKVMAGVYRCPVKGLISISDDGESWITISDKDLGADTAGGQGLIYQRGNCFGFPVSGQITKQYSYVDASGYGPGNYYNSSSYVVRSTSWTYEGTTHDDLWGGTTGTNEASRGPCGIGRHIPSNTEFQNLIDVYNLIADPDTIWDVLKMGTGSLRANTTGDTTCCHYDKRCNNQVDSTQAYVFTYVHDSPTPADATSYKANSYGYPIRPFRNEPVVPDDTSRIRLAYSEKRHR